MTVFGNSIHFVRCPRSKVVIGRLLNRLQVVIRSLLNSLFNCECQTSDACICHACVCVCVCVCVWYPPELVAANKFAIYKQVQCLQRHGAVKVFFFLKVPS